ncbi:MAG: NAD-dependent succinate-semialdehyde dehydrogenase [Cytophagaceae bacterium]
MNKFQSINPYNGQLLAEFELLLPQQINEKLDLARNAFKNWSLKGFAERQKLMKAVAHQLMLNKEALARLITLEVGKPISESYAELEKCAWTCDFYADHAAEYLVPEIINTDATESFVRFDPLGCILAVMPWNFPFWQVFRFAAPALMAGNTAVLKHAANVPQCALAIEDIFKSSGYPEGIFQSLLISNEATEQVINHDVVKAVTLTGSERAGSDVAMKSGKALKKTLLELGGSDAFIVLNDADLDFTTEMALKSRMINTGQSCIAAKRFIVDASIHDQFAELMKTKMENLVSGNPLDQSTQVGVLARKDLAENLWRQVDESVKQGAKVITGALKPEGAYFKPTILVNVKKGMPAYEEELFGPVATIIKAIDVEHAIELANDNRYGLGSSVWTKNIENAKFIAGRIEAGSVFINGIVKSDARLPFGGVKKSGYGRELSGYGIKEFVNVKTVWVGGRQ